MDLSKINVDAILSASEDAICILDSDLNVLYQNAKHKHINGDHVGQRCNKAFQCRTSQCEGCPAFQALKEAKAQTAEKERTLDGQVWYFSVVASPVLNDAGEAVAVINRATDITRLKETARAEEDWERTFEIIGEAITIHDADYNIVRANKAAKELLNLPESDAVQIKCYKAYHGLDKVPEFCPSCKAAKFKDSAEFERFEPFLNKYLEIVAMPRYCDGDFLGTIHIARDISNRKKAEAALAASESRYRLFVESFKGIAFKGKVDFTPVFFHGSVEEITGYSEQELLSGKPRWDEIFHPDDIWVIHESFKVIADKPGSIEREYRIRQKNGEVKWVHEVIQTICEDSDKPDAVQGIILDITDKKLIEERLYESEKHFKALFEEAPVSLWEEDLSGFKKYADELKAKGVSDLGVHLRNHPDELQAIASMIKVVDVNNESLKLFQAMSKDELFREVQSTFVEESYQTFMEGLISLTRGNQVFESETRYRTLKGESLDVIFRAYVSSGYQSSLQKVIISISDITARKMVETELAKKEETLRKAQEIARMGSWEWDVATNEVRWTGEIFNIYGFEQKTFSPDYKTVTDAMHPDSINEFLKAIDGALNRNEPFEMDYKLVRTDGQVRTVHTKGEVLFDDDSKPVRMLGTVYDITERKRFEEEMTKLAVITEQSAEGIAVATLDGIVTYTNNAWASMHGYSPEELIGKHLKVFHTEEQLKIEVIPFNERVKSLGHHSGEVGHKKKDGTTFPAYMTSTILKDKDGKPLGTTGFATDITDRKVMEDELRESLRQKDMLIKEINHRVKNNLALISSLLRLQGRGLKDDEAKQLFAESESRVKAISMIHERLYEVADVKRIDFGEYLRSLSTNIFHTCAISRNIRLKQGIPAVISDIDILIPCGLIVNELMTNALKHAFPDDREGTINIELMESSDGYCLIVKDDGAGMPSGFDVGKRNSMGLWIVQSLASQIRGEVHIQGDDGTTVTVRFPKSHL